MATRLQAAGRRSSRDVRRQKSGLQKKAGHPKPEAGRPQSGARGPKIRIARRLACKQRVVARQVTSEARSRTPTVESHGRGSPSPIEPRHQATSRILPKDTSLKRMSKKNVYGARENVAYAGNHSRRRNPRPRLRGENPRGKEPRVCEVRSSPQDPKTKERILRHCATGAMARACHCQAARPRLSRRLAIVRSESSFTKDSEDS